MTKLLTLAAIIALPAVAAVAQAPMAAPTYVMKAGAGDQYEIQSSRLLLTSTKDAKLRSFATMMVTDHTKSTADVKAAAMHAGLHPAPPKLRDGCQERRGAARHLRDRTRPVVCRAAEGRAPARADSSPDLYAVRNGGATQGGCGVDCAGRADPHHRAVHDVTDVRWLATVQARRPALPQDLATLAIFPAGSVCTSGRRG